ncbi:MAG: Mini-ribonuclease 3 [Bacillaceae bacterium]|nr:Mini-ribonuclease 3 [Bacillaceae bacterium]
MIGQGKRIENPRLVNSLALAYMGDAVLEVYVRSHLIAEGSVRPNRLHRDAIRYVSARAQADVVRKIFERFTEDEQDIIKRGRNAKSATVPKNVSVSDYRLSTGFECLIGYLYLQGNQPRLDQIMDWLFETVENQDRTDKENDHE